MEQPRIGIRDVSGWAKTGKFIVMVTPEAGRNMSTLLDSDGPACAFRLGCHSSIFARAQMETRRVSEGEAAL